MTDFNNELLVSPNERSQWIRLRTLIWLSWVAIAGQSIAITVGTLLFDLHIDIGLCVLVIGVAVTANLAAIIVFPESKRLSEREAAVILLFDLVQISALLFLTGGLHNPFALLVLTPVIISATALRRATTLVISLTAIVIVSVLTFYHMPLRLQDGQELQLSQINLFGFWIAIVIGIGFLALYASRVTSEINSMSDALVATQIALDREQGLTNLGGVVAAAAHELGTPLATIKLVSSELADELSEQSELQEDAILIREQAVRCRDILHSMGRAGKDDLQVRSAPIANVVSEAGEPHMGRGKQVHYELAPSDENDQEEPTIRRRPEVIHGLRNLIQNAVDFACANVWVTISWTDSTISIHIVDDGEGFPPQMLGRIGDPFVRSRRSETDRAKRPGYEGMGLGLFIAKTLLERSGAEISFANGHDPAQREGGEGTRSGAVIEVVWPRDKIATKPAREMGALGENQLF